MGNHEQLYIGANVDDWATPASQLCITNGGEWLFSIDKGKARAIQQLFSRLPLAIEIEKHDGGKVGVVHAEPVGRDWDLLKSWLSAPEKEGEVTLKPSPNDGSYFDPMTVKSFSGAGFFSNTASFSEYPASTRFMSATVERVTFCDWRMCST